MSKTPDRLDSIVSRQPVPTLTWRFFFGWLCRQYQRRCVIGDSMLPTLLHQSNVLIDTRALTIQQLQPNDIICLTHPHKPTLTLIKRIQSIHETTQQYTVIGDNPTHSTDSRHFGPLKKSSIIGRVVCHFG